MQVGLQRARAVVAIAMSAPFSRLRAALALVACWPQLEPLVQAPRPASRRVDACVAAALASLLHRRHQRVIVRSYRRGVGLRASEVTRPPE